MSPTPEPIIDTAIFRALFTNANEGIIIVGDDGAIENINPSANRLFGYQANELTGKKIETLIPSHLHQRHLQHREKFDHKGAARPMGKGFTLTGTRKNGSLFPVEVSLSPFEYNQKRYVIAFIIDMTDKVKTEEKLKHQSRELEKQVHDRTLVLQDAINELERTKEELKEALAQEKELNDMKGRFVSMASHEFRTPLATILSSLSLVQKYIERKDSEKIEKHMNRIKTSVGNMTDILNDFLSLSKLEEGKIAFHSTLFNLHDVIVAVVNEMQQIAKPGQALTLTYKGEENVYTDLKVLQTVMQNLLSNAIKFSDEGKCIEININRQPEMINFSVKDSGIGISKEDLSHLFERFHRGKNAVNIQGTGLGLNIVKKHVELMKGGIEVNSELGAGTKIDIFIPQPKNLPEA